jgi:lysophospholipase L1-like esterase
MILPECLRRGVPAVWFAIAMAGSGMAVEPPIRIMPLGDSLTYGEALTSVQGGYRNKLHELLSTAEFNVDFIGTFKDSNNPSLPDVDHQGWPGRRTDDLRGALDNWLQSIEDPDVVLLLIGTNDIWQNKTVAATLTNLSRLIGDIANRRPFAKIIVSTLPRRTDSTTYENLQQQYNAGIPAVVAQHVALGRQVTLLDMHPVLTPFDYSSDGVHPSTPGYQKMAGAWGAAVNAVTTPLGGANPPLIARIAADASPSTMTVVFSKPVADDSANPALYQLSGGLQVIAATLDPVTKRAVTLSTTPRQPGLPHTLTVSGVKDRTPQQTTIAPESMMNFSASALVNGGFEQSYTGWTTSGNQSIKVTDSTYQASQGTRLVAFNDSNRPAGGVLSQPIQTIPGATYKLTFDMGVLAFNKNEQNLQVTLQGADPLLSESFAFKLPSGVSSGVRWSSHSRFFTADSATTLLTFTDVSTVTNGIDLLLDNVGLQLMRQQLAVTSTPASGAWITLDQTDTQGLGSAEAGLIREYASGTEVIITAPSTYRGMNFLRWRKNGVELPSSGTSLTVTMDGYTALDAIYQGQPTPTFSEWLASCGADPDATADSDGDAVNNGIEYVIGGHPVLNNDAGLLPTVRMVGGTALPDEEPLPPTHLAFTYRRTRQSLDDPQATIAVEWSTDLVGSWLPADAEHGAIITVDENAAGEGIDLVEVLIPAAPGGQMFARLKVVFAGEP